MSLDYGTLNAIGITILAAFGLWAFQYAVRKQREKDKE